MLAEGLGVFSAVLLSVVEQGSGTGCLECSRSGPEASGAWDVHLLRAPLYLFVQPMPHRDTHRMFCVCDAETHTSIHKRNHGWMDNPRGNHFP